MPRYWNHKNPLSRARLLELLEYVPETGKLYWRVDRNSYGGKAKAGSEAGQTDRYGYRYIGIDGGICQAHTLVWVYVHGAWPVHQIDHRNMIQDDNRIENLREATMTMQRANQRVRRDSTSGIKGIQLTKSGKWRARIRKHGVEYHLGRFDTAEAAKRAYDAMAQKLFGEFARAA